MGMEILKDKINKKEYDEAIQIVRKEIINELVKLIKIENQNFEYTNIYNLTNACEKYIKSDKKNIVKALYTPECLVYDEKDELVILLEKYKKLTN